MIGRDAGIEDMGHLGSIILYVSVVEPFFDDLMQAFIIIEATSAEFERVVDWDEFGRGYMKTLSGQDSIWRQG